MPVIESNELQPIAGALMVMPNDQRQAMDESEIALICAQEIDAAKTSDRRTGQTSNQRALEYFHGTMTDTQPQPNRSQAMSHDVADVIGWMMPALMRVFFSGDTFAEFAPQQPGDEAAALQAGDYLNFVFLRECNGCGVGWNAMHDALLLRAGVIKFWWDKTPEYMTRTFTGLSEDDFVKLVNEPDVEVMEHTAYPDPTWQPPPPPPPPAPPPGPPMGGPPPGPPGPQPGPPPPQQGAPRPPGPPMPQPQPQQGAPMPPPGMPMMGPR